MSLLYKYQQHYRKNIFLKWIRLGIFMLVLLGIGWWSYLLGAGDTERLSRQEIIERLTGAHEQLTAEHERLTGEHEQLTAEHERLNGAHEQLTAEHERLTVAHEQLTAEHERLTDAHGQLTAVHERLKSDNEGLKEQIPQGIYQQILDLVTQSFNEGVQSDFLLNAIGKVLNEYHCESFDNQRLQGITEASSSRHHIANFDNNLLRIRLTESQAPGDEIQSPLQKRIQVRIHLSEQTVKRIIFTQTTPIFESVTLGEQEYLIRILTINEEQNNRSFLEVQVMKCQVLFDGFLQ